MTLVLFYISTIFRYFTDGRFVEYVIKNKQTNWKEGGRRTQLLILSECFIHRSTLDCSYSSWKRSCIHFSHHTLLIFCNSLQTLTYICIIKFPTTAGFLALFSGSSSLRGEKTNNREKKRGGSIIGRKVLFLKVIKWKSPATGLITSSFFAKRAVCYLYLKEWLQAYIL